MAGPATNSEDAPFPLCSWNTSDSSQLSQLPRSTHLSSLTSAGMPPDLKMDSRPCLWWERLWRAPTATRVVSRSLLLESVRTRAATICEGVRGGGRGQGWGGAGRVKTGHQSGPELPPGRSSAPHVQRTSGMPAYSWRRRRQADSGS